MDPIYLNGPSASAPYDQSDQMDFDDDEEEDQLVSDVEEPVVIPSGAEIEPDPEDEEDDLEAQGPSANSKRKAQRKPGVRVPGQSLLPQTRVENILRENGGGGPMSKEATFILSVATEEFIKRLAQTGHSRASSQGRNVIEYRDMAASTSKPCFRMLEDVIPAPKSLSLVMELRAQYEKRVLEEDPALTAAMEPSPIPDPSAPILAYPSAAASLAPTPATSTADSPAPAPPPPAKGKARATNGRAKVNGEAKPPRERRVRGRKPPTEKKPIPSTYDESVLPKERRSSTRTRDKHGRFSIGSESGGSRRSSRRVDPQGWSELPAEEPLIMHIDEPSDVHLQSHAYTHPDQTMPMEHEPLHTIPTPTPTPTPTIWIQSPQNVLAGPASAYVDERARSVSNDAPFGSTGRTIYTDRVKF